MKFKDLPDGRIFQFIPQPGTRETAIKAGKIAYLLRTGEQVDVHSMKSCEDVPPLIGTGYRLGVTHENKLTIFSHANETQIFTYDFLVIGHHMRDKRDVKPIVAKADKEEFDALVDIILRKLEANAEKAGNLVTVLRESLFEK